MWWTDVILIQKWGCGWGGNEKSHLRVRCSEARGAFPLWFVWTYVKVAPWCVTQKPAEIT